MPRLWDDTLESHRQQLHQAILDTTARLIHQKGLTGVTMQDIARETGIGRATLYKHFKDLTAILESWHQQHLQQHLQQLHQTLHIPGTPLEHLEHILTTFAQQAHHHPQSDLSHFLHQQPHALDAQQHLLYALSHLIEQAQQQHQVREDTPAGELALYCLHSLTAARGLPEGSLHRLVHLILKAITHEKSR